MMSSVRVGVRVRPMNQRELELNSNVAVSMMGKVVRINKPKDITSTFPLSINENVQAGLTRSLVGSDPVNPAASAAHNETKEFPFHFCFWSCNREDPHYVDQEEVYRHMGADVVKAAYEGYNACVFAYGQTGSGKTYSMMGSEDDPGLIPRICKSLYDGMVTDETVTYRTEVSYLEIYNEKVHDLLKSDSRSSTMTTNASLRVREHPKDGPYVQGLSRHITNGYKDVLDLMGKGNISRTTASTNMNDTSSRSHAIFTILFTQARFSKDQPEEKYSKIHLVDLAGSERANATGATGHRLKEGASINKSLVLLGNVISSLAEKSTNRRVTFIPYRDSVLTWLLKDSLGGNSKTMMIATISPASCNYSETVSTLRYASRAKCIINRPEVNEDPNVKLIRELRDEIARLRSRLDSQSREANGASGSVAELLQASEARVAVLTQAWTGRWRELEEKAELDLRPLETGTSGVVLDSKLPYLVTINTDELSTGISLFHLKEGSTKVGSDPATQDIVLMNESVLPHHCSIETVNPVAEDVEMAFSDDAENSGKVEKVLYQVTLSPNKEASCKVNGAVVDSSVRLLHGCILTFGHSEMFRFNNPAEAKKMRREGVPVQRQALSLLSRSLFDLNKVDDNFSTTDAPVIEQEADMNGNSSDTKFEPSEQKLIEKRQELAELESRLSDAEVRWRREAQEREAELETKRKRLEELQSQLEQTRSRVSSETKKSRRLSLDMERYRNCQSPAELFCQIQSDLEIKYDNILDSEMERLNLEIKELEEQKVREKEQFTNEENALRNVLNTMQKERDTVVAEVQRLEEDARTLAVMLERGELNAEDFTKFSGAVTRELQEQVTQLESRNASLDRLTVSTQEKLQALGERRRIATQDAEDAGRDLEIREAALRRDLNRRMNEELSKLVEELVRSNSQSRADESRGAMSPPPTLSDVIREDLPTSSSTDSISSGQENGMTKGKMGATEKEVMALTMQVLAAEESLAADERVLADEEEKVELKRFRLQQMEESHRLSLRIEEEVKRRMEEDERKRMAETEAEREREAQRKEEINRMREEHAQELANLRRRLRSARDRSGSGRSPSISSEESGGPSRWAASFSPLRATHSMVSIRAASDVADSTWPRTIVFHVTRYIMRSTFVEYELQTSVGIHCWSVCRRYSIIREHHEHMKKSYPEIKAIEFPPKTAFWEPPEKVAQARVPLLERYFRRVIEFLQSHPYCLLNPDKSRAPLSRRIVYQVLPILRKGQYDNTRFTTA